MRRILLLVALCISSPAAASEVVVSVRPLHALVAGVMQGSGIEPQLLVSGKGSLHDYALKPSQVKALREAKIIIYIGDRFEHFLAPLLPQLPGRKLAMEQIHGLALYPIRTPHHHHDAHAHEAHEHEEEEGSHDLHLWLSPANARLMVFEIAQQLSEAYPSHRKLFSENAQALDARIESLDQVLKARLQKLQVRKFITFHDATQYFDRHYGLNHAGSLTLHPEQGLSAKHMQQLRSRMHEDKVACVFREPEFDGAIVQKLVAGTGARIGLLDPEATLLAPGPELYFQLMEAIASSMESCLQ